MGLVFKNDQWVLEKDSGKSFTALAGSAGGKFLRSSATSFLTGSLLLPSGAVSHSNIFSARGAGGLTGDISSRISANRKVSKDLDLDDFSSGFTWAGWIKSFSSASNSNATIFFSSLIDGGSALIFRRNVITDNVVFEYYNDNSLRGKVTTNSTPWSDGSWVHYGVTFSSSNRLRIYKNGNQIQFDVNTDTGGSTPTNVTSHTFNTNIPNAARVDFRMFGGDLRTSTNDGLTAEVFNIGFWNEELSQSEISALYNNPGHNLSTTTGSYNSQNNLVFNCKFDQTAADGTNIAFSDRGLVNRSFVSGSSKPN